MNLFEQEKEDYCELVRVGNFLSKNCIEYESNGDRNKTYHLKNILIKLDLT